MWGPKRHYDWSGDELFSALGFAPDGPVHGKYFAHPGMVVLATPYGQCKIANANSAYQMMGITEGRVYVSRCDARSGELGCSMRTVQVSDVPYWMP